MLSGLAAVVMPERVGATLDLVPSSGRGVAETRAGLGGTYTALGAWALFGREPAANVAVGVTWLGAGGVRLASLLVDRPRTNAAFWAYLALELGLGATSLMSASLRRKGSEIQFDDPGIYCDGSSTKYRAVGSMCARSSVHLSGNDCNC